MRFSIVISLESSVDSGILMKNEIAKSGRVPGQSGAHSGGPDLRSAFPGGRMGWEVKTCENCDFLGGIHHEKLGFDHDKW